MNRWNPFYKALAILIAGVLLSFSYSVLLNLLLFAVCMALILAFPQKSRKQLAWIMIPVSIAAVSLFMTGFLHPASGTGTKEAAKAAGTTFSSYNFSAMTAAAGSLYNALQLASRVLGFAGLGLLFAFTTDGEEFILSLMQQGHVKPKFAYGILAAFHLMPNIAKELDDAKCRKIGVPGQGDPSACFFAETFVCLYGQLYPLVGKSGHGHGIKGFRRGWRTNRLS